MKGPSLFTAILLASTPTLASSSDSTSPPSISEAADGVKSAMNKLSDEFRKYSTLAGRRQDNKPLVGSFTSRDQLVALGQSLLKTVHWQDLLLLTALGWGTVPLVQLPYDLTPRYWLNPSSESSDNSTKLPYRRTVYYQVADHLQQVTKIALIVYLMDVVKLIFLGLGWKLYKFNQLPHAFAQTAYAVWSANRLAALKRHAARRYVSHHPETFGRIKVLNRLADACIYGLTVFVVLNILQVQMGLALQSFLAFGSVGTLAVGLASKGIAQELINGLMLASSDRIYEGDDVQFGSGDLSGKIVSLGWMETVLRRGDEVTVSIPNSHLLNQRVSNLSRVRRSQVKQVLRVSLDDADKIPVLIDRIKHEIRMACPELITDGSRPFRVYWTAINPDHCEITIDSRFHIKPTGDVYLNNKQNVLAAIHRALKQTDTKLVVSE